MKKTLLVLLVVLASFVSFARTVKTETYVVNSGTTVAVALTVDDLADAGAATFVVTYDPTILVCMNAEEGVALAPRSLIYADSGSGQLVLVATKFNKNGGEIAKLKFHVRSGTEGLFSDVTIAEADFGAKDGVTDVMITNPTKVVNGMVRVMAKSAEVKRLEESFVVHAKSELASVVLGVGDMLQASADKKPIMIEEIKNAQSVVEVKKPTSGWSSGEYALLTTKTVDLAFALEDAPEATIRAEVKDGLTTYFAAVKVEGEIDVALENGVLDAETAADVRKLLVDDLSAHPEVLRIMLKGELETIRIAADLGIAPMFTVEGTTAVAVYRTPTLTITAFEPRTGRVAIRIVPGEGNEIRSNLAVGCIHVYGTSNLTDKMRYISDVNIDLTPYLGAETKGEAELTVALGSHTFIKVKAETLIKQEGEQE